jgi:hypothetical protein
MLIRRYADDAEAAALVLSHVPSQLSDATLARMTDPDLVLELFVRHVQHPAALRKLAKLSSVPPRVLLEMSPPRLDYVCSLNATLAGQVVDLIDAQIGGSDEQWSLLEGLWSSHDGPTSQLLSSVALVASD